MFWNRRKKLKNIDYYSENNKVDNQLFSLTDNEYNTFLTEIAKLYDRIYAEMKKKKTFKTKMTGIISLNNREYKHVHSFDFSDLKHCIVVLNEFKELSMDEFLDEIIEAKQDVETGKSIDLTDKLD